jgi:hypothetical protein
MLNVKAMRFPIEVTLVRMGCCVAILLPGMLCIAF